MVFITTGQRIATENFSDGVIYKVTFVDTTISYMMCVGIGQDFVMLQGPNPSLFCLTMSSASRVSTIDVHDPTPPEPPTPIENALQYQTGEPPFTFTTTESSLFSWYIEGPCGEETANLWSYNPSVTRNGVTLSYDGTKINFSGLCNGSDNIETNISLSAGTYTIAANANRSPVTDSTYCILIYKSGVVECGISNTRAAIGKNSFTLANDESNIKMRIRIQNGVDYDGFYIQPMMNTGSDILPFEPYNKYKIPISCNSNLTTIYLDAPLGEGEKLYSVNIDTEITTDIGENTLTVDTTDTPTMQIVYDIYAEG